MDNYYDNKPDVDEENLTFIIAMRRLYIGIYNGIYLHPITKWCRIHYILDFINLIEIMAAFVSVIVFKIYYHENSDLYIVFFLMGLWIVSQIIEPFLKHDPYEH